MIAVGASILGGWATIQAANSHPDKLVHDVNGAKLQARGGYAYIKP